LSTGAIVEIENWEHDMDDFATLRGWLKKRLAGKNLMQCNARPGRLVLLLREPGGEPRRLEVYMGSDWVGVDPAVDLPLCAPKLLVSATLADWLRFLASPTQGESIRPLQLYGDKGVLETFGLLLYGEVTPPPLLAGPTPRGDA
jgi:hypothetical protein